MASTKAVIRRSPSGPRVDVELSGFGAILAAGTAGPLIPQLGKSETTVNPGVLIPEDAKILITRRNKLSPHDSFGEGYCPSSARTTTSFKIIADATADQSTFDWALIVPPQPSAPSP